MPRIRNKDRASAYRERLRNVGLRHTLPRERILSYLDRKNVHPTPEELFQGLRKKGYAIGLSTVYLNLQVLRDVGLIYEFKDPKGVTRYDGYSKPHHHLACRSCGRVEDILASDLPEFLEPVFPEVEAKSNWDIDSARVTFVGYCPRCKRSR